MRRSKIEGWDALKLATYLEHCHSAAVQSFMPYSTSMPNSLSKSVTGDVTPVFSSSQVSSTPLGWTARAHARAIYLYNVEGQASSPAHVTHFRTFPLNHFVTMYTFPNSLSIHYYC